MKTAILYARVATPDQLHLIQEQFDEMAAFCKQNNLEVVSSYSDVAHGANFERQGFLQMLSDLNDGSLKADVLLFTKWDRLSRNFNAALMMLKILHKLNLKVQSLTDFDGENYLIFVLPKPKKN